VLAAGALQYSQYKFIAAITVGRMARYSILAFLAARYGRGILKYLTADGHVIIATSVAVVLAGVGVAAYFLTRKRKKLARASAD
jgi:membrane protein DedA with SNARE-associated domain